MSFSCLASFPVLGNALTSRELRDTFLSCHLAIVSITSRASVLHRTTHPSHELVHICARRTADATSDAQLSRTVSRPPNRGRFTCSVPRRTLPTAATLPRSEAGSLVPPPPTPPPAVHSGERAPQSRDREQSVAAAAAGCRPGRLPGDKSRPAEGVFIIRFEMGFPARRTGEPQRAYAGNARRPRRDRPSLR